MMNSTFIGWYDPSKRTLQARLENAIEIFEERRGYQPALVLVNDAQAALAEARRQYQQALDDEREDAMQRAQEIIDRRRR